MGLCWLVLGTLIYNWFITIVSLVHCWCLISVLPVCYQRFTGMGLVTYWCLTSVILVFCVVVLV